MSRPGGCVFCGVGLAAVLRRTRAGMAVPLRPLWVSDTDSHRRQGGPECPAAGHPAVVVGPTSRLPAFTARPRGPGVPRRADGARDASPLPPRVSRFFSSLNSTREPGFTTKEFQEFPISLKRKPLQDLLRGSEGCGRALCSRRRLCAQGSALGGPSLPPAPLGLGRGAWGLLSGARSTLGFLPAPRPLDGSVKLPAGWPRPPGWQRFTRCAGK